MRPLRLKTTLFPAFSALPPPPKTSLRLCVSARDKKTDYPIFRGQGGLRRLAGTLALPRHSLLFSRVSARDLLAAATSAALPPDWTSDTGQATSVPHSPIPPFVFFASFVAKNALLWVSARANRGGRPPPRKKTVPHQGLRPIKRWIATLADVPRGAPCASGAGKNGKVAPCAVAIAS